MDRNIQECELKFGSWTYDGDEVNLSHYNGTDVEIICEEATDPEAQVTRCYQKIDRGDLSFALRAKVQKKCRH